MSSLSTANTSDEQGLSKIGVGLRHPHYKEALLGTSSIDFVEVHAENFFAEGGMLPELLNDIALQYPISLHSTSMGLGSAVGINGDYLQRLKQLSQQINPILISDHACFTWSNINGNSVHAGDLLPLEFTQQSLQVMVDNVNQVQKLLGRQILVENLSAYVEFNFSDMSETEFLSELVDKTGCGLLVDLNNLLVNARNFSDQKPLTVARKWLREIPSSAVGEIHLAGFTKVKEGELVIDDHSQPVSPECWLLYRDAVALFGAVTTLIEWDNNLPTWSTLLDQASKARSISTEVHYDIGRLSYAV
ncbi:DUF692 domain-containing protein [Neptuniibacter sp. QD37_6]|uniref:DUF692 domain-containing protein n=1 Tax=Neptuniibacter sp. QD37_6 TaxID=3398210 RepID=UPI0039F549D4